MLRGVLQRSFMNEILFCSLFKTLDGGMENMPVKTLNNEHHRTPAVLAFHLILLNIEWG